ncbi:hypothetical protein SRABI76_02602 [Microbacterium oxydans]|uniref:sigma-70 family RNA polymerase sigma factor n=1 Tax=Microbacterium oxydans TaxID=82380 RepID=UPI001D391242|nr:sigma-70 family RNA polymerase sigma factor [Microbacterium oxydans]CAH0224770.1 hypothetical protein SRABI76_02602 [Microbacterium oxydans]
MNTTPQSIEMHGLSDEELLEQAQRGSPDAFAALWRRHAGVAYSVARTFRHLDADDIVSEAFTRVLEAMKDGKGPRIAFRPYLVTAVRNVGRYQFNRQSALAEREHEATVEVAAPSGEDVVIEASERSHVAAAFLSLPTRWQEVLWYREVDGLKPRVISEYVGIPANAVSALVVRAKRALRDAWITAQLADAPTPGCADAITHLAGHARGALSPRTERKLTAHLATCETCPAALEEAERLSNLTLALLPVLAGVVGATAYSTLRAAPAPPQAALPPVEAAPVSTGVAAAGKHDLRRPQVAAAGLGVAALVVGVVIAANTITASPDPRRAAGAAYSSSVAAAPSSPALAPAPSASPSASPSPSDSAAPISTPLAEDTGVQTRPPRGPSDQTPPGAGSPPPSRERPPRPPLEAPIAALQQPDARLYPRAGGSQARPGAKVELVDESGAVVGTATANSTGAWTARVTTGTVGTHSVRARQTADSETSPASAPMAYTVSAPPELLSPRPLQRVSAAEFLFSFCAPAGTVLQREIEGATALQTITTPANGLWREYFAVRPGRHTVKVRHYDPHSGDYGPSNIYNFIAH